MCGCVLVLPATSTWRTPAGPHPVGLAITGGVQRILGHHVTSTPEPAVSSSKSAPACRRAQPHVAERAAYPK